MFVSSIEDSDRSDYSSYLNILEHSSKLVDVVRRHADLAKPFDHVFFLFAVGTGVENQSEKKTLINGFNAMHHQFVRTFS